MADEIKKIKVGGKKYNIVDAGAVRKTGDTMTGNLYVRSSEDVGANICSDQLSLVNNGNTLMLSFYDNGKGYLYSGLGLDIGSDSGVVIDSVGGDILLGDWGEGIKLNSSYGNPDIGYFTNYYTFGDKNNPSQTEGTESNPAIIATREWVTSQAEELDHDIIVAALGYEPVNKTGDTMTGELKIQSDVSYEGKLSLGGGLSLEAASGYADINSGYALTLSTPDTDISMESHYISLSTSDSKVHISDESGITFDSKITVAGSSEKGYYKLPSGDGSTSTNRYTLATQEWVAANAGGAKNIKDETSTGALSQLKDGTTFTFVNPNSQYNNENLPIGASGQYATSLGGKSRANGKRSLATGTSTFACGDYSHVEGNASISEGIASHAEGLQTTAKGDRSHTEGQLTLAIGSNTHAEGYSTVADSYSSHAEGAFTKTGVSDRNGWVEWISSNSTYLHIDTTQNISVISATCSRGTISTAVDNLAHDLFVNIDDTTVDANNKVLIRVVYAINGSTPTPPGPTPDPSVDSGNTLNHAEGYMTQAFGAAAHSEGHTTAALGQYSHAEGIGNVAFGLASHVEGANNEANGQYSHAGGSLTKVNGMSSVAIGGGLISNTDHQAVFGRYNTITEHQFVIGNGTDENHRSNLFTVGESGVYFHNNELAQKTDMISYIDSSLQNYYTKSEIVGQGFAKSTDLAVIKGAGTSSFKTPNSTVSNQGSAAIGYGTSATAWGTLAFGASSKATQSYAVAGGQASEANAEHSFAFGENVKTGTQYQVAFGKYNAMKTNTVFEIGTGTSSNRSNAFEVYQDGHAEVKSGMKIVNGNLQIGNTTLSEAQLQKILALVEAMDVRNQ